MPSFEELKAKYHAFLDKGPEVGFSVQNLHQDGDKLLVRGIVPTDHAKNVLWDVIKTIDANVPDAIIDINVQPGMTYNVAAGDTLSKIAKRFYGDANAYHKIFEANRDQLSDPDKIQVGQTLKLS
ncbi:MAG TPA: LysM peptidoglycan-binding domain-containing protein [Blastocatellia bacterium]|nr:LysM peptidoglycan-binding domain-containing protein [Blastocatellia bacterium]